MIKKHIIKLSIFSLIMTLGTTVNVFAASTDVLVQDKDKNKYQYNIDELSESFIGDKILYNDFTNKGEPIGYFDNKIKKYVDTDKIIEAFTKDTKKFNIDTFTENAKDSDILNVQGKIQTIVEQNGSIINGKIIKLSDLQEELDVENIY